MDGRGDHAYAPGPALPRARGPVSEAVLAGLREGPGAALRVGGVGEVGDPWGEDLQLALYVCYELHYRGFDGVDPAWEWDLEQLRVRGVLEDAFLEALRTGVGATAGLDDTMADMVRAEADEGHGISQYLLADPDLEQFREYVVHQSVYHPKKADPHTLLIPRLTGRAKAGVVTVEFDESGGGRAERMHATLFADLMRGLGLDPSYGAYLDRVPAPMLAVVNLMSLFAWHRARRGMMVGHFAAAEAGTPPSAARFAAALERLGVDDPACARFFTGHDEADAVREQLVRREVVGGLVAEDPALAPDIVFGARATGLVEDRFSGHLRTAWRSGRSSLLGRL